MRNESNVRAISNGTSWQVDITDGTHQWQADTDIVNGGANIAAEPESYVLGALGACTAITLRMYAERKQWRLEGVSVELNLDIHKDSSSTIMRTVYLEGELDEDQRQRLLDIAEKCPIHRMLAGKISICTEKSKLDGLKGHYT